MSAAETSSRRASITGSISPMWPMIILSFGCLSNVPAITMRRMWIATSECQPQPAVASTRSAPSGRSGVIGLPHIASGGRFGWM